MYKSLLPVILACCLVGCGETSTPPADRPDADNGSGGAQATGGMVGSGGASTVGGEGGGSGGRVGSGGATSAGGATGVGGATGTGGRAGSGGATGKGGATGTGGRAGTGGATGKGGATGTGGATGSGGTIGTGGRVGTGGAVGTGGSTSAAGPSCDTTLPASTGKTTTSTTITISGTKDYGMQQFCADPNTLGPGDQTEGQQPVFKLAANAVLKNVIIGGAGCSAADGVHCESGSCTLENVWFGDVGEDAISFKGSSTSQVMTITGGGAFSATDKTIQHNGPGTIKISNFYLNTAGKLYRSCGNCGTQYTRHVVLDKVTAKGVKSLVGINTNYNDTATLTNVTLCGGGTTVCQKYIGNSTGAEPTSAGSGPDGTNCIYTTSDITTK